jgi:nucleotide-binding universal stress UspA family protein
MALKDLLVHVGNARGAKAAVAAAAALADRHNAHIVGLGIRPPLDMPGYASARLPESVVEIMETREKEMLDAAEEVFNSTTAHAGLQDRSEWRSALGNPHEILGLHARYADLTLVAQHEPGDGDGRFADLAEDVLVSSGRPLLAIPYIGAVDGIGEKVIVAWNASREAARAVGDAMPILDSAHEVEIFIASDKDIGDLPGADIAAHLARHGIDVTVYETPANNVSVGDALLNRASETGADLIVMGGYGRSRFREFVLGGVTRHMLQHMTVPVLMSH